MGVSYCTLLSRNDVFTCTNFSIWLREQTVPTIVQVVACEANAYIPVGGILCMETGIAVLEALLDMENESVVVLETLDGMENKCRGTRTVT